MLMKKILYILVCTMLLCGLGVNASVIEGNTSYEVLTVEENDTLWDIAAKRIDNTKDIREYIYDIEQFNHIASAGDIYPGMKLKIPQPK